MRKSLKIFLFFLGLGIIFLLILIGIGKIDLISQIKAQFEQTTEEPEEPSIDLSDLVADIDLESRKAILYMPNWPEVVEEEKVLFIPSTGIGTIYLCPHATSLKKVNPQCQSIMILDVGESKENLSVETTNYDGQEYYLVYGVRGTGGGEAHRTQIIYEGDLTGQFSDEINLKAKLTLNNGNELGGETISFILGNQIATVTTNENGVTTVTMELLQIPGNYALEAKFAGEGDYLPSGDSEPFEILKENVVIGVPDKESFAFDTTTLEAEIKDDDGNLLHQEKGSGYFAEFKIATATIGTSTIDEYGKAKLDWNVNLIPKEAIETYPITVIFLGNEYYNPAEGQATFTLKSAKWLKQDAVAELEAAKTGDKKTDKKIDKIIGFINQSLDENLWLDAARLVFFERGFEDFNEKEFEEMFNNPEWTGPKTGIVVFHYEKAAVELMMNEIKSKKTPDKLKQDFEEVIQKLTKSDILLAQVSIYDAKNTPVQNPKFQKIVEHQIKKAEEELIKAQKELAKNRPDKAILRFAKSWLHSQLAIKFANIETNP